jgi:glycosyltransferase involved in cell wall biosynthesis
MPSYVGQGLEVCSGCVVRTKFDKLKCRAMQGISIVIPCYNPPEYLMEAIASARAQRGCTVEVVLVNDGTNSPEGSALLQNARSLADRYIEQPNRGLAAARNAGFKAASHEWIIPLDADDVLEPEYAEACGEALDAHPEAAFAYTDYRVFGTENYVQRTPDYNLYQMLDQNPLSYAALIRRREWAQIDGYDEAMTRGYEDWEFWLRLGSRGRHGRHGRGVLFGYRKHGPSLLDTARAHHAELVAYIHAKHPELYDYDSRARVKSQWEPAIAIVATEAQIGRQSVLDWKRIEDWKRTEAAAPVSRAVPDCPAFLVARDAHPLASDSAELAALAVWAGHHALEFADGSTALSRRGFELNLIGKNPSPPPQAQEPAPPLPPRLETIHRHLANAGLLSLQAWTRHPLRSAGRVIPLRVKERVNRAAVRISGRRLFDLSFYLQFQPSAVESGSVIATPLVYMPEPRSSRRRIGLITPHLGPGGAERVLLEIASALNPDRYELFLIATQSAGDSWRGQWKERAGHIYDLRQLVHAEKLAAAIYSICVNWELDALLVQNSLSGYSVLPQIKQRLPGIRAIDVIHSVDVDWNIVSATREIDSALDVRVAISERVREELLAQGIAENKIRLIWNGVDLQHFDSTRFHDSETGGPHRILFAGRMDAVKRPLLLAEIALGLRKRRGRDDFRFVVAGDGPESAGLRRRVHALGLDGLFEFRGHVADVAPDLAACQIVILTSRAEGIPLIVLEAFAASRPVVASAVGAVPEVVTPETGILVPPGKGDIGKDEIEKFVAALDLLINDPSLRRSLGTNGRRLVERRFDRRQAAEAYRALFDPDPIC